MTGFVLDRTGRALPAACLVLAALAACSARASERRDGDEALRSGRYEEAVEEYQRFIARQGPDLEAYRGLVRALREIGRYDEAVERIAEFRDTGRAPHELANALGEIYFSTGRLAEARQAFEESIARRASDALTAELNLAILDHSLGRREEALRRFDRFIDVYNQTARLSTSDLTAVATACRYLAVDDHRLLKDALRAYDEAAAADPQNLEPRLKAGELFLAAYNGTDARESFQSVLDVVPHHPRALVGLAQVMKFEGSPKARELTEKALEVNPRLVEARVLLARLLLDLEEYEDAAVEAEKALSVNPVSLEALSVVAAAKFLAGDREGFARARDPVFDRNPGYADFYNTLAEVCVQNRLYQEAADFAGQAIELDGKSWSGYGLLGLNQLRLGRMDEGRENLERSFAGDPYNVWIKNTLDLLDTLPQYRESRSERFLAVVDAKESDLLAPYVLSLAEEAYERLAEKYGYEPPTPIRIEVYPSHADFSVRTIGLAGLGALGVCFGPVVAIDSPSAREKGQFNWGSTLWHELAHAVTLGITDHKVPRWLSEGLSVYEERLARSGWGDDVNLPFLLAYKQGKLLPVAELNNGFVRPSYPQQISVSYYQASLVSELIDREHGFAAIRDMLAAYRKGMSTEEVFGSVLGTDVESFDRRFRAYLDERFARYAEVLRASEGGEAERLTREEVARRAASDSGDFAAQLALGEALFKEDKLDEAERYLERAKELFPEYGGNDSPYWYLGQIHQKRGEWRKAAAELSRLVSINENHYQAHRELAAVRERLGDREGALEALQRALYIYPFEAPVHEKLAELSRGLGRHQDVVRERRALLALEPVDRAQALYELARAYYEAGDADGARREVLRALEIAPQYDQALELLLELRLRESGGSP